MKWWRAVNTRVGLALAVAAIASGCGGSGPARDAARMPGEDAAGDSVRGSDGAAADRADSRTDGDDTRTDAALSDGPADASADGHGDASDAPIAPDARDAASELGDAPGEAGTLPPSSCPASGQIICESFENVLPGQAPSTSPWKLDPGGYCGFFSAPPSGNILGVQERVVYSGNRALEANTFSNQCLLSADLGSPEPELWLRLWLRLDSGGSDQFDLDEVTFFGIGSNQLADDPRVAVGVRGMQGTGNSPCAQAGIEINNTGSGTVTGCLGKPMPTDRWTCFELHLSQQSGTARSELFIDGEQQSFIVPPATAPTTTLVNAAGLPLHYLTLAVRQYASRYTLPAYYDDVAVATQRIGCQ